MDYYQKYQKYKFKYLNLLSLNQSGGDYYTEKDFYLLDKYKYKYEYVIKHKLDTSEIRALFELINEKGFLKDKDDKNELLEDIITTDNIHITKAVLIGNNVLNANSILKLITSGNDNDPFTRNPFTITELINVINKLNDVSNENYIINYIISERSILNIQIINIIKNLNNKERKILISKNKMVKLLKFSTYIFIDLLNNYKKLLSDTITYDEIINAIKTNYLALILVPENKLTQLLCLDAVEQNSNTLECIPDNKKSYEMCQKAVINSGLLLQYVPEDIKIMYNFEICKIAIEQNSYALEHILIYEMTPTKYLYFCELALKNNIMRNFDKIDLSLKAVKNNGLALQYVNKNIMSEDNYDEICISAVKNNGLALQYVDKNNMREDYYNMREDYYNICCFAIIENPLALQYVDKKIMLKDKYYEICKLALQYLNSNIYKISTEEIYEICKLAVEYHSNLIDFVPKQKLLVFQQTLLLQIVNPNLRYIDLN
jgi:hypothetical protein